MAFQNKNTSNLIELVKILGQQTNYQSILKLVAHNSSQLMLGDSSLILMVNPDTRETVKTIMKDGKYIEQKEYRDIHIHVGGWIIKTGKPFLSNDIQRDDRFIKGLFDKVPIKSVLGVPLIVEGIYIGALMMLYEKPVDLKNYYLIESLENIAAVSAPFLRNAQKLGSFFTAKIPESSLLLKYKNAGLYGKSPTFIELLKTVEAAAKCNVRVLLIGNTGTGKELIAKAIHNFGSRANSPFVTIDCGAIPNTLLESALFGHKRGSFTGADSDQKGLFVEASGGTLFMDEINNLPYDMQSKLLRVLQENQVRPVGSDKTIVTDVRIIAASSVPLKELVNNNKFREDLFFRLHVFPIYIPDLSERQEDITLLGNHFLKIFSSQQNRKIELFHEEVIDFMKQRIWKGNIRELENFVERLVTLTSPTSSLIGAESFPTDLYDELAQFRKKQSKLYKSEPLKQRVQKYEAQIIEQTLLECNWNQSEAARKLETSEKNIRYKMETLNIRKPET